MFKSKKINILLIEESGKGMRAVSLPCTLLVGLFFFFVFSTLLVGWIFRDYRTLKPRIAELTKAENVCFHQKKQIAYLGRRIQDIHEKLKELDEYDLRLRTVAHIATGDEGGSLVGVGGSNPGGIGDGMTKTASETRRLQGDRVRSAASSDSREEQQGIHDFLQIGNLLAFSHRSRWPVKGWVCSNFGVHPSSLSGDLEFHKGVDIATKEKAPILAPADGVIISVDWREGYGRRVVLSHGLGLVSVFSHLGNVFVAKGERLRQGDKVATAGGTGRSAGPYVHYEVHFYGVPVDPQKSLTSFLQ
jgi:murein DD-endopeptidase MepM/ murein hydrolase activator NlpD